MKRKFIDEFQEEFDELNEKIQGTIEDWIHLTNDRSEDNFYKRLNVANVAVFSAALEINRSLMKMFGDLDNILFVEQEMIKRIGMSVDGILIDRLMQIKDKEVNYEVTQRRCRNIKKNTKI